MGFLETSALEGVNVDEAFHQMIEGNFLRNLEIVARNKTMPVAKEKLGAIKR